MRFVVDREEPVPDPLEAAVKAIRDELDERGAERAGQATARRPIRQWILDVPEERGPLDLDKYAFQIEPLYSDRAVSDHEQVHMKSTQIGWSTGAIRQALYFADAMSLSVLYTFPTDDELKDFSRKRIRPVIRGSAHLRSRMSSDAVDNVGQKQIGQGWISFRGLNKAIDSIDVDVLIIDEYDTSDQANIDATEYRLSGAESADIRRRIGVPSIPGFGIDAFYEQSDQRVWSVKCSCGEWNPMRGWDAFQQNVDQDAVQLVCRKAGCRRPLDVRKGEWVATFPDRDVRGYHAPKLLVPGRRGLARMIANSKKTRPNQVEDFHRRDLGQAFAPAEGRLGLDAIRACVRRDLHLEHGLPRWEGLPVAMGIDVASARAFNVVIEQALDPQWNAGRKVFVGEVEDDPGGMTAFQRLCHLMDQFNVTMCGIDNEPDGRLVKAFAARFPGRVYRTDFFTPGPGQKKEPAVWNVDDSEQFVSLWRTKIYDATFERWRAQKILIPHLDELPPDYPTHLGNLYRRKTELPGDIGKIRVDYVRTGPEDYAQCEAYLLAAIELYFRNTGIEVLRGDGPVALADEIEDFVPSELSDWASDSEYRPGFE